MQKEVTMSTMGTRPPRELQEWLKNRYSRGRVEGTDRNFKRKPVLGGPRTLTKPFRLYWMGNRESRSRGNVPENGEVG